MRSSAFLIETKLFHFALWPKESETANSAFLEKGGSSCFDGNGTLSGVGLQAKWKLTIFFWGGYPKNTNTDTRFLKHEGPKHEPNQGNQNR